MNFSIQADVPPLRQSDDGVIRIADTRIPLERVVRAFLGGMTPEQIVHDFDVLKVEDVYAVISYYLHHRDEVDEYMTSAAAEAEEICANATRQYEPSELRARLLARRPPKAE